MKKKFIRISTLTELAEFINSKDNWDSATINEAIFSNGWIDEQNKPNGVARNGNERCMLDNDCIAYVA